MIDRRRLLAALAALILPAPRLHAATGAQPASLRVAPAAPAAAFHVVDGWLVTDRDLAEIARLAR